MTQRLLRWLVLCLSAWVAGCATTPADGPRPQAFDVLNEGVGEVHDVQIRYGTYVFPAGGAGAVVPVPAVEGTGLHQSATVAIPATAQVHWVSADGEQHDATVPVANLILDPAAFHGLQFIFVDDHLDVAVAYERPRSGMEYARTWSSASVRVLSEP